MNKILVTILLLLCSFAVNAAEVTTIRFGVDPTFAPYESIDHGELVGIDIDVGNAICKHLNANCEFVKINFSGAIPALKAQKIDAILSAMTITEKRKKQVLFSDPLYFSPSRLLAPKDVELNTTAEALEGKTIGIAQGTIQANYAKTYWQGKDVNLVTYPNAARLRQDLVIGRIDASLSDVVSANSWLMDTTQGKNFHLTGAPVRDPAIFGVGVGIAFRKNNTELKKLVDGALAGMREDGTYYNILQNYAQYGIEAPAQFKKKNPENK